MVRHVIIWTLKDEYTAEEKEGIRNGIREGLEGLAGKIPGLKSIRVVTKGLESSTGDLMLDSVFEDARSLKEYSGNPLRFWNRLLKIVALLIKMVYN